MTVEAIRDEAVMLSVFWRICCRIVNVSLASSRRGRLDDVDKPFSSFARDLAS